MTNPLIDATEAAAYLGIHPETVRKMCREKRLPGIRIGVCWRFRISALDSWLETQSNVVTYETPVSARIA